MSILTFLALIAALTAPFSALTALLLLIAVMLGIKASLSNWHGALPWLLLGWLVWPPLTLAFSQAPGLSISHVAVLTCLPLGWMVGKALIASGDFDALLKRAIPTLLLILVIWGLLQGPNTFTAKPQGPFIDPNTYAAVLNLLVLPVLADYLAADLTAQSAIRRTLALTLLASTALLAFMVASRGAFLAVTLVLAFMLTNARAVPQFKRKLLLLGTVAALSYVAANLATSGTDVFHRLVLTTQHGDSSRLMLARAAWQMILDHPWLGTGFGSFRLAYPAYRDPAESLTGGSWVHNDYLQLWQEAGIPMLLLLLGLAIWVGLTWLRLARRGGVESLRKIGFLAGIVTVLLHANFNFLLFFALTCLLVGLYLAKVSVSPGTSTADSNITSPHRTAGIASGGYVIIMGILFIGQIAVEGLLDQAQSIHKTLLRVNQGYPRYEVAYWVSVMAPFHPTPQQVMALELANLHEMTGRTSNAMRNDALTRMDASWKRAPCYLPYSNDALTLLSGEKINNEVLQRAESILQRNFACNARHGLSYYYAGLFASRAGNHQDALTWWQAGLAASTSVGERILLSTAILSMEMPEHTTELDALGLKMADALRMLEANPTVRPDQSFWSSAQYKLLRHGKKRAIDLLQIPTSHVDLN